MFVLHPSSRCDVCLDAFSSDNDMSPHAIPCGHVFCKPCLETVIPPKCPLCRKNYDPTRLKKLHVDRQDGLENPKEGEFLQRIALSFDAPEDQLQELEAEVDEWLRAQPEDSCLPVRKARMALDGYKELRRWGIDARRDISHLKQDQADLRNQLIAEKEQASLIEQQLLQQKDEMQIQLDAYKTELERLRTEIDHRTLKNPLPPPPKPVSFARYPAYDPKFAPNGARPTSVWGYGNNNDSAPLSFAHPRNLWPDDDRENQSHVLNESNGVRRDRKGKGSDPHADLYDTVYAPKKSQARPATAPGVSDKQPVSDGPIQATPPKAGIIPGAPPNGKFMPPDDSDNLGIRAFRTPQPSPIGQTARDSTDPYSVNGFAEAAPASTAGDSRSRSHPEPSTSTSTSTPASREGKERERKERRRLHREKEKERHEREREARHREHRTSEQRHARVRERTADVEVRRERTSEERDRDRERRRERREAARQRRHTTDDTPEALPSHSSATRSRRSREDSAGGDSGHHASGRVRSRRASDAAAMQHSEPRANAALASILSENPARSRRASTSRVAALRSQPPLSSSPIGDLGLLNTQPSTTNSGTQPMARHSLPTAEGRHQGQETAPSRRSIHSLASNGSAESWGTISSAHATPNSLNNFAGLDLRSFNSMRAESAPTTAVPPYRSPVRPAPVTESSSEEEDTENEGPTAAVAAGSNDVHGSSWVPQRQPTGHPLSASAVFPSQTQGHAPAHGSRHTHAHSVATPHIHPNTAIPISHHHQQSQHRTYQQQQQQRTPRTPHSATPAMSRRSSRSDNYDHYSARPHPTTHAHPNPQPLLSSEWRNSDSSSTRHSVNTASARAAPSSVASSSVSLPRNTVHAGPPPFQPTPLQAVAWNQMSLPGGIAANSNPDQARAVARHETEQYSSSESEDSGSEDEEEESDDDDTNSNANGAMVEQAQPTPIVNALGLAIAPQPSPAPRQHQIPISAPRPRVPTAGFMAAFSHGA